MQIDLSMRNCIIRAIIGLTIKHEGKSCLNVLPEKIIFSHFVLRQFPLSCQSFLRFNTISRRRLKVSLPWKTLKDWSLTCHRFVLEIRSSVATFAIVKEDRTFQTRHNDVCFTKLCEEFQARKFSFVKPRARVFARTIYWAKSFVITSALSSYLVRHNSPEIRTFAPFYLWHFTLLSFRYRMEHTFIYGRPMYSLCTHT